MTIKTGAGPFKFTVCSMCGKQYIKQPGSIYKVKFKGRVNNCCSYSCYRKAQQIKEDATYYEKKNTEVS